MNRPASGSLTDGRLPFWKQSKPKLAADVVDPDTGKEKVPTSSLAIASIVKTVAGLLGLFLVVTFAAWLVLGITVMPTPRVAGDAWAVKWSAWPEGAVPADSLVAVTEGPVDRGVVGRAGYLFGAGGITVQRVIAGPGGTVTTTPEGYVAWNGVPTTAKANGLLEGEQPLGDAYLTECVAGDCGVPGTAQIVPIGNIMGEALGIFTPPFNITAPSAAATGA